MLSQLLHSCPVAREGTIFPFEESGAPWGRLSDEAVDIRGLGHPGVPNSCFPGAYALNVPPRGL